MFRHVVMFRWVPEATEAQKVAVSNGLRSLPGIIPSIRAFRFGPDAEVNAGNFHFAVVADFDDRAGYEAYRADPTHQAIIADYIAPISAERAAVQYETQA